MPRGRRRAGATAQWSYARLERRLTLLSWLHERLGFHDTKALLEAAKPAREGFDDNGRSHLHALLRSRDNLRGVTPADLARYDDNIRANPDAVYRGVLAKTLRAPSGGGLRIADVRGSDGELGLRAGASDEYFGLIYVGDTARFKNLARAAGAGITVEDDAISGSLFDEIGRPGGTIDVLIGSRKFIEGWNSWRVSNMGLLNIGSNEGSQIIQLFGRGVRLRGLDMTLKRSSALAGQTHPEHVGLLETLNIFALRANYMAQFRAYLEREGIVPDTPLELPLFVRPNRAFLRKGLVAPRVDDELDFKAQVVVPLEIEDGIRAVVNAGARAETVGSGRDGPGAVAAGTGEDADIPPESLALVDWNSVHLSLIEHKERNGMDNLVVRPSALKDIMEAEPHGMVYADAYRHDEKAQLHERLKDLSRAISERSNRYDVALDSYIVSATPYETLHKRYDDGSWSRSDFARKHILFPERNAGYDYMKTIFAEGAAAAP